MSRQAHFKEKLDGRIRELKPLEVGVQVPRCIYTEVPPEGVVGQSSEAFGGGVPEACRAEGVQDRRRASAGGPCSHDDLDTTETCSQVVGFMKGKSEYTEKGSRTTQGKASGREDTLFLP